MRLLPAAFALLATVPAVNAADLLIDQAAATAAYDPHWTGPYVGVFGSYAAGTYDESPTFQPDISGWSLGVAAGYNFALGDDLVVGVVGDIALADIGYDVSFGTSSFDWVGSLRGRVGIDAGGVMPYLTAGLAIGEHEIEHFGAPDPGTDSAVYVGWTVGAGLELAIAENISLDFLYRYSDYGSRTLNVGGGDPGWSDVEGAITTHQVSAGLNLAF